MSIPILTTKLYIPSTQSTLVTRSCLVERLMTGVSGKLTLVSAPAGFGKTTLVSEWLAASRQPAAWYSLDDGDNDLTRFLAYFVASLQATFPNAPNLGAGTMVLLQSPQPPSIETMLTTLLNEITNIPESFMLVLDDYHVIDTSEIDNMLIFLLEHLPPQMHLVITTREDPALPLARLRARGHLTEVRAADLCFTFDEADQFFNQVMGLALSSTQIEALSTRTEGWIAGLQLAAISMRGRTDTGKTENNSVERFVHAFTGSHHFILDYLIEEVLQQQPAPIRSFLLQTSILNRLHGALCDAVTQQGDGRGMLSTLERSNLFIVPLDDQRQWYRYHHLFADVLQTRLQEEQPEHVSLLHQRASVWYEQNSLQADAIHHALAAKDFARVADLAELVWREMDRQLQTDRWLSWVQAIPETLLQTRPVLSVGYAWSLLNEGEIEAAEPYLRDAEQWRNTLSDQSGQSESNRMVVVDQAEFCSLPATIASARAYQAQTRGDVDSTMVYARQALDFFPEDDALSRAVPAAILSLSYWGRGELEASHQWLTTAMAGFQTTGNKVAAISGTFGLADMRIAQGRLNEAVRTYERSLKLVASYMNPPDTNITDINSTKQDKFVLQGTADLHLGLSMLHHERGEVEAAREQLATSTSFELHAALPDFPYRLCIAKARLKASQAAFDDAIALLDEAERLYYPTPIPIVRPVAALRAKVWIAQGRLAEAWAWVREQDLSVEDDLSYLREFEHMTLVRLFIAQHRETPTHSDLHQAMGLLDRLLQAAEMQGRMGSVIELLVLQALAHDALADRSSALTSLARALTIAEPEGYLRLFVDEGQPMQMLLSKCLTQGTMPTYVTHLLAVMPAQINEEAPAHDPNQQLIEPLSKRELEVLRLLALGHTNQALADELVIALSTVKKHVNNIFGKLGVASRTQAVNRARELGLLQ
ncbi:MAG: LuxR C-terminal-related transcriptional regulator [Chloroflexota bacterium]